MRSAMQGVLGCLLAFGVACSDSHPQEATDSETHFLEYCGEGECGEGLSCICGVCTASCEQDAACAGLPGDAQCVESGEEACGADAPVSVCDASCDEDADCSSIGPEHRCDDGACRAGTRQSPPSPPAPVMCGVDEEEVRGATKRVEVDEVLSDVGAYYVVGYDGGAAFIDRQGRVMVLPAGETVPLVIREFTADADSFEIVSLASDGQTIYWSAATQPPPATLPDPQFPMPPSVIERIDVDGSGYETLVDDHGAVNVSLSVDDDYVYFTDQAEMGLMRVPKGGGDVEMYIEEARGRPARSGDYFYWLSEAGVQRGHAQTGEVETVLTRAQEPRLDTVSDIFASDDAVMLTIDDPLIPDIEPDQTIALLDPEAGCLRFFALPDGGITSPPRPQGDHVFWKGFTHGGFSPGDPESGARLWRTDLATGETVELEPSDLAITLTVDVLGQDEDHLFVTTGDDLLRIHK